MSQTEFVSYADDNTPYVASGNVDDAIKISENDSIRLFKWCSDNQMKANKQISATSLLVTFLGQLPPEENCCPALTLTLILTGDNFPRGKLSEHR